MNGGEVRENTMGKRHKNEKVPYYTNFKIFIFHPGL